MRFPPSSFFLVWSHPGLVEFYIYQNIEDKHQYTTAALLLCQSSLCLPVTCSAIAKLLHFPTPLERTKRAGKGENLAGGAVGHRLSFMPLVLLVPCYLGLY